MRTREDKKMMKLGLPFLGIYQKKIITIHISCSPSEEPKDVVNFFFKRSNHETRAIKRKSHLPWSHFMVHSVNRHLKIRRPLKALQEAGKIGGDFLDAFEWGVSTLLAAFQVALAESHFTRGTLIGTQHLGYHG